MKVKVTWRANNPFIAPDKRDVIRTAEVSTDKLNDVDRVEEWAREATPEGFHLHQIDCNMWRMEYDDEAKRIIK